MVLNTSYLNKEIMNKAVKSYSLHQPKNIRLQNFFQDAVFIKLQKKLLEAKYNLKFDPYKYRYYTANVKEIDSFLLGRYFAWPIVKILRLQNYMINYKIKRFDCGCYTLLHDSIKEKTGIDFIMDFSKSSQHFGGEVRYVTKNEELLGIDPIPNSVSFIDRKRNMMKYVKYVSNRQKYPLIYVVGTIFRR